MGFKCKLHTKFLRLIIKKAKCLINTLKNDHMRKWQYFGYTGLEQMYY